MTAFYRTEVNGSLVAFWVAGHHGFPWRDGLRDTAADELMQSVVDARAHDPHVVSQNPRSTSGVDVPYRYICGGGHARLRVVDGWDRASVGMRVGERRWAVVPPSEGFYSEGFPAEGDLGTRFRRVPRDATIVFDFRCVYVHVCPSGVAPC